MPASIVLNGYSIYFRQLSIHGAELYRLGKGHQYDAAEHLHAFLTDSKNRVIDRLVSEDGGPASRASKKRMWIDTVKSDKDGFYGFITCGDTGRASSIRDSSGEVTHQKTTDEADLVPYFYRLLVPDDGSTGVILVTQRIGITGIKSLLSEEMRKYFSEKKDTAIVVRHVVEEDVFKKQHDHKLHEVRAIYRQTNAPARSFFQKTTLAGTSLPKDAEVIVTIKMKPDKKQMAKDLLKKISQQQDIRNVVEIEGFDDAQDISFLIESNGRKRTYRASKLHQAPVGIDVTDDIELHRGNPVLESINTVATDWAKELKKLLDKGV